MNTNNWKQELQLLLELFERESVNSLKVIRRCFNASGLPFDENFRKHFLKMSTARLDTSFDTVLYHQLIENQMPSTSTSNTDATIDAASVDSHDDVAPNVAQNENVIQLKMENNADDPIEIVDMDDEGGAEQQILMVNDSIGDGHVGPNALAGFNNGVENRDGEYNAKSTDVNNENGNEVNVKHELKVKNEIETGVEDLPMVEFDPNKANDDTSVGTAPLNDNSRQSSSSRKGQKQLKRDVGKRFKCTKCVYSFHFKSHLKKHLLVHGDIKPFKCTHCDYASRRNHDLKKHQKVHADGKLMGVARNPIDGSYKCSHCDQKFTEISYLYNHLIKSHKKNQRIFNCAHCLHRFERETEKEKHEIRCCNRRYECHLCKKYITKEINKLQRHMRTHSGEKPFECKICNKCFVRKYILKRHLESIHYQK